MDKQINYAKYQMRLMALEDKTRKLLQETGNDSLAQKMVNEIADADERKDLRLAFVGQYNAGKSTIIAALTGRKDIKIDSNVATGKVSEYKWHDIVLMDTPGILAGKTESHDEATKAALKECDLIFYTLTSQLFDDVLFNNFIDLAYNQHFADKMFIVINKMGMESGEFDQLANNYTISLERIFKERGYDISDFPIAFIDAADYLEGNEDDDEEFVRLSNFEDFIDKLNLFVAQKGVIKKRFDTPIRILQSYLKDIAVAAVDKELSNFYSQYEAKLSNSMRDMKRDVANELSAFDSKAMGEVIELSNGIGYMDENQWTRKQENLNKSLLTLIQTTSLNIEGAINQNYQNLLQEVGEFGEKDSLNKYEKNINAKLNSPSISIEERKSLETQKRGLCLLKEGASSIGKMSNVTSFSGGISQASGSQLHSVVTQIGHFFGKKFGPWQATRWAANIGKFAKFGIPVITVGIDIWIQCREEKKENQRMNQIKASKEQFVTAYQGEVNKIKNQFETYLRNVLQNYINKRDEINRSKDELISTSKRNEQISKSIKELDGEYVDFIEIVNNE